MSTSVGELSIAFSLEELAVLHGLLGLRGARPGAGDPGGSGRSPGPETLAVAARSLRARGVVADDGTSVAAAVADLLGLISAPRVSVDVTLEAGSAVDRFRFALSDWAGIEQAEHDGVRRFTPFAAEDTLLRLMRRTGLDRTPASQQGEPSMTARAEALRRAARQHSADRVAADLVLDGVETGLADVFGDLIAGRLAIVSVRVRRAEGGRRFSGADLAWMATDRGLWRWPMPGGAAEPWGEGDLAVSVQPLPVSTLLAELAEAIAGAPVEAG